MSKIRLYRLFLIVCGLLINLLLPLQVFADGGAPNLAYVAGAARGVGIIDVAQRKLATTFSIAGNPSMIMLSPDARLLYVTQPAAGRIEALAAKTGQTICTASYPGHPSLLALSVDGTVLYVAGAHETTILAIDAQTCALQHTFQTSEPVSWLVATGSPTGDTQLWMAGTSAVSILDEQGQALATIPVPGGPQFLCIPSYLTAYVATRQGSVMAIDMLNQQVFATLFTGGSFGPMDYNAITGDIYVPDQQHNQVDVLSPVLAGSGLTAREPEQIIHLIGSPQSIAITNDGQFGFVALSGGQVAMLDIPGRTIVATVSVGGSPHFIITGPYPPSNVPVPVSASVSPPNFTLIGVIVALFIGAVCAGWWSVWKKRVGISKKVY
ncbi:MAG TPA: YncE family protein [Ktedonobacteraceae bacterium]